MAWRNDRTVANVWKLLPGICVLRAVKDDMMVSDDLQQDQQHFHWSPSCPVDFLGDWATQVCANLASAVIFVFLVPPRLDMKPGFS